MQNILVVVDMQNDFLTGPLGNAECAATIEPVKALIKDNEWVKVVFTRDTHFSNYSETLEGTKLPVPHCLHYSKGWEIADGLVDILPPEKIAIINKITFGSFDIAEGLTNAEWFDPNDFEIHICGVCTSICVLSNATILRAQFPNTPIVLHTTATADVTPEMKNAALICFKAIQCDIVD